MAAKLPNPDAIAETVAEAQRTELEDAARPAMPEYLGSLDLERLTGVPSSTWRYWSTIGEGPRSFKLGRRRVWKRATILACLDEQERASP